MDLYVVAASSEQAKQIWPSIKHRYINGSSYKNYKFVSQHCTWRMVNPKNIRILLCGEYWRNPSLERDAFTWAMGKSSGVIIDKDCPLSNAHLST
jgi:hypothetical protein